MFNYGTWIRKYYIFIICEKLRNINFKYYWVCCYGCICNNCYISTTKIGIFDIW